MLFGYHAPLGAVCGLLMLCHAMHYASEVRCSRNPNAVKCRPVSCKSDPSNPHITPHSTKGTSRAFRERCRAPYVVNSWWGPGSHGWRSDSAQMRGASELLVAAAGRELRDGPPPSAPGDDSNDWAGSVPPPRKELQPVWPTGFGNGYSRQVGCLPSHMGSRPPTDHLCALGGGRQSNAEHSCGAVTGRGCRCAQPFPRHFNIFPKNGRLLMRWEVNNA